MCEKLNRQLKAANQKIKELQEQNQQTDYLC